MKKQVINYADESRFAQIVKDWKIKVYGWVNGQRINKLIGVRTLLEMLGEELFNRFINRAYNSWADKCACKVYGGRAAVPTLPGVHPINEEECTAIYQAAR